MKRIFHALIFLSALLMVTATAKSAYADSFSVSWSGMYGPGSGIFTATSEGGGAFLVTAISGTQNGTSISLLSPGAFGGNDNQIFRAGPALLDTAGIGFAAGADDFNIYYNNVAGNYWECLASATSCSAVGDGFQLDSFTVTPSSSVPEPGSIAFLSVASILILFMGLNRRKSFHRLTA